jgi:excinuclease ABC subunit A
MTVITGVSGSGKSSLAFDTIYAEGQRRFVDCLATYARQFLERLDRPDADFIGRLEPPLALKQSTSVRNARSTVAHAGEPHCVACGTPIDPETIETAAERLLLRTAEESVCVVAPVARARLAGSGVRGLLQQGYTRTLWAGRIVDWPDAWTADETSGIPDSIDVVVDRFPRSKARRARAVEAIGGAWRLGQGHAALYAIEGASPAILRDRLREGAICRACGTVGESPSRALFSANNPIGACPDCQGFGRTVVIDPDKVVPDPRRTLRNDAILPFRMPSRRALYRRMIRLAPEAKVRTETPWCDLTERERRWVFEGGPRFPGVLGLFARLEKKRYKMHVRILLARFRGYVPCAACGGTRLKAAALGVRIGGQNLAEISSMPITELRSFFDGLALPAAREARVRAVLREIRARLQCLDDVGLGYLDLGRTARTLSGGETQRLRLASGMGASLTRTLYILDEPTVGLHARDASRVLGVLQRICRAGNTVIVVEHDPAVIDGADHLIVLGPEGGEKGGERLFEGPPRDFLRANPGFFRVERGSQPAAPSGACPMLTLRGLSAHNLKIEELAIPLRGLVAVSGVSGSGKSTLLDEVIYRNGRRFHGLPVEEVGAARAIEGYQSVEEVLLIGQDPLGRSTRSNAVSFVKVLPLIRDLFARTPDAKERSLKSRDFSFNVPGGRCEVCKGIGTVVLEMHFLPDVEVACEACNGRRFREEVLEVSYRGRTITGVLDLTADEAAEAFADRPEIARRLQPLQVVGLGYLRLGQPTSTLSGGEAQRLKLASFLAEGPAGGRRLFLFDEPTTGLHARDVARLLGALRALIARGNAVIVVEHHLDFLSHADWVIDLGPGPGDAGGRVVYEGPPDGLVRCAASLTGKALAKHARGGAQTRRSALGRSPEASGPLTNAQRGTRSDS